MLKTCEVLLWIIAHSTDGGPSLPSRLEDDKLETFKVAHDGTFKYEGKKKHLSTAIFSLISMMEINQKVLSQKEVAEERGSWKI